MPFTISANIIVPELPDNDVWWQNFAAFKAYFQEATLSATFETIADNPVYVQAPFNNALNYGGFNVGGVDYEFPTKAQFASLVLQVSTLNASYVALLTALKDAGIIAESI